jgi:hypothetical protein
LALAAGRRKQSSVAADQRALQKIPQARNSRACKRAPPDRRILQIRKIQTFRKNQTFRKTKLSAKPDLQNRVRLAGYLWRLHADIAPNRDTAP